MIDGDNIKQVQRACNYLKNTDPDSEQVGVVTAAVLVSILTELTRLRKSVDDLAQSVGHIDRNL